MVDKAAIFRSVRNAISEAATHDIASTKRDIEAAVCDIEVHRCLRFIEGLSIERYRCVSLHRCRQSHGANALSLIKSPPPPYQHTVCGFPYYAMCIVQKNHCGRNLIPIFCSSAWRCLLALNNPQVRAARRRIIIVKASKLDQAPRSVAHKTYC